MTLLFKKNAKAHRKIITTETGHAMHVTRLTVIDREMPGGCEIDFLVEKIQAHGVTSTMHTVTHVQDLDDLIAALVALRGTYR